MSDSIALKAYGKLNLLLDIVGKRHDGYHTLKSVFQSVSVYDMLTVTLTDDDKITIDCDDESVPCDERNLVYKACTAFFEATGKDFHGVNILLEKNIPSMAGMVGGSADCAATLVALNVLTEAELTEAQLCDIGEKLGADVPFCIVGGTVLCEGIGEILTPLPDLEECYFAVCKPEISISTPECYKKFDNMIIKPGMKVSDIIDTSHWYTAREFDILEPGEAGYLILENDFWTNDEIKLNDDKDARNGDVILWVHNYNNVASEMRDFIIYKYLC